MALKYVLGFLLAIFLATGVWDLIELRILTKVYREEKLDGERFIDFCVRRFHSQMWHLRKKLRMDWFYNSKLYKFFTVLKSIFLIMLSIGIVLLILYARSHEMGFLLDMKW